MEIFHDIFVRPLFNVLIFLYNTVPGQDIGLAIIGLTVLVKIVLWPLTHASLKSQRALQKLQPKLKALQEQFKEDRERLSKELMRLYSEERVNPLSSCLPILIQLPVLIGLYRVLSAGLKNTGFADLYTFVSNPGVIDPTFFGVVDLAQRSIPLAILAAALQYWQMRMLQTNQPPKSVADKKGTADEEMLAAMNQSMKYFMPIMTLIISITLPGGLALYWVAVNALTILQQKIAFQSKEETPETPTSSTTLPSAS